MKKEVRDAMIRAKTVEKTPVPSKEEIVAIYKDGLLEAEKLRKLLKPSWFISDVHAKKISPSTRKKKTL